MNFAAFEASLTSDAPPADLPPLLEAMWRAAKNDWDGAHKIVQSDETAEAAWVHAYLHRVEGDLKNAGYWYKRAGKPEATGPVEAEWRVVAAALSDG